MLKIKEVAELLNVSYDTLRRWDKSGKLKSIRPVPGAHRHYHEEDVHSILHDIFGEAKKWISQAIPTEPPACCYCPDSPFFQYQLNKFETDLQLLPDLQNEFSLIVSTVGEIGNNSFDHNIGSWPDIRGVFFGYDLNKRKAALADRGQGILKTLKRVKPELQNDQDALYTAFTETITGRAPEQRGNGLKFVKMVITEISQSIPIQLSFQSGRAALLLEKSNKALNIKKTNDSVKGCLALISF